MSYQLEEVKLSQQIFYHLLTHRELSEHQDKALYYAYTSNEVVMNLACKWRLITIMQFGLLKIY